MISRMRAIMPFDAIRPSRYLNCARSATTTSELTRTPPPCGGGLVAGHDADVSPAVGHDRERRCAELGGVEHRVVGSGQAVDEGRTGRLDERAVVVTSESGHGEAELAGDGDRETADHACRTRDQKPASLLPQRVEGLERGEGGDGNDSALCGRDALGQVGQSFLRHADVLGHRADLLVERVDEADDAVSGSEVGGRIGRGHGSGEVPAQPDRGALDVAELVEDAGAHRGVARVDGGVVDFDQDFSSPAKRSCDLRDGRGSGRGDEQCAHERPFDSGG